MTVPVALSMVPLLKNVEAPVMGAPGVIWVDDGETVMMEFDGSSCGVFESF